MTDTQGKTFLCFLPKVEESAKSVSQQNTSHPLVESDGKTNQKTPDELLEVMQDRCFLRVRTSWYLILDSASLVFCVFWIEKYWLQQESWWAYEFCYHKQLRQFHVDDDNKVGLQPTSF